MENVIDTNLKESFSNRVLRDMTSGVLVINTSGQIIFCNKPAIKMLEIPKNYTENGSTFSTLLSESNYNDEFFEFIIQSIYHKDEVHVGICKFQAQSEKKYVFKMSSSYLITEADETPQIVITFTDETKAEALKVKLKDSSATFTTFLVGVCIWLIIFAIWLYNNKPFPKEYMTKGVEVLGIFIIIFIFAFTSLTFNDIGLKSNSLKKDLKVTFIIVFISFIVLGSLKFILLKTNPGMLKAGTPFINFKGLNAHTLFYIYRSLIQEFLARSGIQANIKRITTSKYPAVTSIIVSSLIFAVLHIHLGLVFMAGAAILAGLLGILYDKQDSIIGVWIVHYFFGVFGTLFSFI